MADETETTEEQQAESAAPAAAETTPAETAPAETAPDTGAARPTPTERREARAVRRGAAAAAGAPRTLEQRIEQRAADRKRKAQARSRRRVGERTRARSSASAESAIAPVASAQETGGRPKVRQGVVISAKPEKTIVVRIDDARRHRRYEKIVRSTSAIHAHDERNDAGEGDTVRVMECRPMSRTKRWRLVEILERAK